MFKENRLIFIKLKGIHIQNSVGSNIENLEMSDSDAVKKTSGALGKVKKSFPELEHVNATIGVIKPQGADRKAVENPPHWLLEAREFRSDIIKTVEPGYNFIGEKDYLNAVINQLFPELDPKNVIALSAEGGTSANAKTSHFFNTVGAKGVTSGAPIWPGNKGAVERIGNMPFHLYQYLDKNGEWNFNKGFIRSLEKHNDIIPMLHGICQNPLGIDIPKEFWGDIVEVLKHFNIPLVIDLAYLGFGKGVDEDLEMVRFFQKENVKMVICFSDSKYLQQYSEERVGAILGVNFENTNIIQSHLVQQSREITSARASAGQRLGAIIRMNSDMKEKHEKWQGLVRKIFQRNRKIILESFPTNQQELFKNSKGMFMTFLGKTKNDALNIISYAFPELASVYFGEKNVPKDAKKFPEDLTRVAMVPIEAKDNANVSGARIGLSMSAENADKTKATLEYVADRVL